ncbi:putative undecaprenyl diphosphate synthase-domain-containing protein [Tricharina praecox]|uniref:putative undecaprenyl diphosphate synthase-domain-containing protein n=1 Tax=Tricharina praecox TaxID=43433 RepID=UPI00221F635B|nr:putative undecaprenyl diphosphate synthase-domain-containing protein [Tricharina praecox]KAI5859130.1 putative undecaprenyl diphosphate synthase-domain-containing protein [Tricharina praecox]
MLSSPPIEWASTQLKELFIHSVRQGPVPQHIAFVMDGNRRFARKNHIETAEGHNMGFEALAKVVCYKSGVKVVTVYAFSIENFKRPMHEVNALMEIAKIKLLQLCQHGDLLERYGASLRILGERELVRPDVLEVIDEAVELTKNNDRSILNVCFPYTSRHEIASSIRDVTATPGLTDFESITQQTLEDHLFTAGCPPLDLVVRTSGVRRLSDFMLWQCHKDTEIVFIDCLWPQFDIWRFLPILIDWGVKRKRLEKAGLVEVRREGDWKDAELNSHRQRDLDERKGTIARATTF